MLSRHAVRKYLLTTYQDTASHLTSRLVLFGSRLVMLVAVAEIMSRLMRIPMSPFASNLTWYSLVTLLLWVAAIFVVYLSVALSLALVVRKEQPGIEEPRHTAYAWSCGLIGMTILSAEVFDGLELRFEDPLLGVAGLNTLVEEVRLRIAQAGRPTEWSRRHSIQRNA